MKGKKGMIAIIDYEDEFKDKFSQTLQDLSLSDKYEIRLIKPTSLMLEEQMVNQCISELRKFKKSLMAIMIDIVLFELGNLIDLTGIKIVKNVREEFPKLPIFLVTKHIHGPEAFQYLPILVWGSLEDVDGVLIKQYLCNVKQYTESIPFSKEDFEKIINKATKKRNAYSTSSILLLRKDAEEKSFKELEKLFELDIRSTLQIKEIGSTVFKHLIVELFPGKRGTISYFRPGFSGSYLFKIDISSELPNSWVVKLNETEKIQREVNNYKKVEKIMDKESYPCSVKESVNYGKWGAFAVALEREVITLFDYLNSSKSEREFDITEEIANILKKLYGEQKKISTHLWKEHYTFSPKTYLGMRAFFEEQERLLEEHCGRDKVNLTRSFVDSKGTSEGKIYEKVHWIYTGNIHGDLNTRNILLNPGFERIVLIDYANYGVGHVVKDTAKLEADCIFSVLDGKSDKFYDWNRINEWKALFDLLKIESIFNSRHQIDIKDVEIKRIYNFVKNLRKVLKKSICPSVEADEHLKSLLYYSFHYLTYPDISIQKKVFALEWIYEIITQLKNAQVE
jgi:hypothetical protein